MLHFENRYLVEKGYKVYFSQLSTIANGNIIEIIMTLYWKLARFLSFTMFVNCLCFRGSNATFLF